MTRSAELELLPFAGRPVWASCPGSARGWLSHRPYTRSDMTTEGRVTLPGEDLEESATLAATLDFTDLLQTDLRMGTPRLTGRGERQSPTATC